LDIAANGFAPFAPLRRRLRPILSLRSLFRKLHNKWKKAFYAIIFISKKSFSEIEKQQMKELQKFAAYLTY